MFLNKAVRIFSITTGVILLTLGFSYAQTLDIQLYEKGIEYAARGEFNKAKIDITNSQKICKTENRKIALQIIEDVRSNKITKETAVYMFKGINFLVKEAPEKSIPEFNKVISTNAGYIYAYLGRGFAYFGCANFDSALADFNQALKLNPNYSFVYSARSSVFGAKGNLDSALADCKRAIALNSEDVYAHYNLGNVYFTNANFQQAIYEYSLAIQIAPSYALAYRNRGNAYLKIGDYAKAISDYNKAIEMYPDSRAFASVYKDRALAYFYIKVYDKSLADVNKAESLGSKETAGLASELKKVSLKAK